MSVGKEIKDSFKNGSNLTRLIYINLAVLIIVRLIDVIFSVSSVGFSLLPYLALPPKFMEFIRCPWTIITYMFLHWNFLHIIFNMLVLYWFGRLFLSYYSQKQLVGLYILGGIGGGILFLLFYNTIPFFNDMGYLLGASASVLAITIAVAATAPNQEINLVMIGKIRLKYLALIMVCVDLLSVTSFNKGGHIAHLGGAAIGYLFALQDRKGRDITAFINKTLDFFVNLFKFKPSKPKMKVTYHNQTRNMNDMEYNKNKKQRQEKLDEILDKVKKSGYDSLTADEKKMLFDESQRL